MKNTAKRRLSLKGLISGIVGIAIGIGMAVGGFALSGFNFSEVIKYEVSSMTEIERQVTGIDIDSKMGDITIVKGDAVDIEYKNSKYYEYEVSQREDGKILIEGDYTNFFYRIFGWLSFASRGHYVKVTLPENKISLDIDVRNGKVSASDLQLTDINCETINGEIVFKNIAADMCKFETTNGKINLEGLDCTAVTAETTNGSIVADRVTTTDRTMVTSTNGALTCSNSVANKIIVSTTNGKINLNSVSASDMSFSTVNGAIEGSIVGDKAEYTISVSKVNGSSNLSNQQGSTSKNLNVSTTNGGINISFIA